MQKYSKVLVAILGGILTVLAQQYSDNKYVQAVLPLATALGVYSARNK